MLLRTMTQVAEILDRPFSGTAALTPWLCFGSAALTTFEWSAYAYRAAFGISVGALVPMLLLVSFLKFTAVVGGLAWGVRQSVQLGLTEAMFLAATVMGGGLLLSAFALSGF